MPGRPGEFHPESPTDPDVNLSTHPARATPKEAYRLPPRRGGPPVTRCLHLDVGDLLPLLHGHYPVSSLLRSSAPLAGASVLSASCCSLVPFPLTSPTRFSSSVRKPR